VRDDKGALAGRAHRRYHGNVGDALSVGKTGVLMRQPYSRWRQRQ
jgi:hypothetical protein